MSAYAYPTPTYLADYRENNPTRSIWEALALTSVPGSVIPEIGLVLVDQDNAHWSLHVDTDGSLLTTKL